MAMMHHILFVLRLKPFALSLFYLLSMGMVWGQGYSIQIAALSNAESALSLRQELQAMGYPAFLTRTETATGVLYRLRVGAYAEHATAERMARTLQGFAGTTPRAAPLESLPTGVLRVIPQQLHSFRYYPDFENVELLPLGGQVQALRVQGRFEDSYLEPRYFLIDAAHPKSIPAWRLRILDDGSMIRVFSEVLASPENPAENGSALARLAQDLALSVEQVSAYLFYAPGTGQPYVVRAERLFPTGERDLYPALGDPRTLSAAGPALVWFIEPEGQSDVPDSLPQAYRLSERQPLALSQGLASDGEYIYANNASGQPYRLVPGTLLWYQDPYLMVADEGIWRLYYLIPTSP